MNMNLKTKEKIVIFDFDGVIADSMNLWFTINTACNPDFSRQDFESMSYGNFFDAFESDKPTTTFTPSPTYHQDYSDGLHKLAITDDIKNILIQISSDHHICIVSSGSEGVIQSFLKQEGVSHLFSEILGYETHKRKTIKFKQILEKYDMHPSSVIFITDTLGDINEAHEVEVRSIGVTWGLHSKAILERGKPHAIVHVREDLLDAIHASLDDSII
jgi:phosphoglycolate phosphatase